MYMVLSIIAFLVLSGKPVKSPPADILASYKAYEEWTEFVDRLSDIEYNPQAYFERDILTDMRKDVEKIRQQNTQAEFETIIKKIEEEKADLIRFDTMVQDWRII
jgi:hypothetical protein